MRWVQTNWTIISLVLGIFSLTFFLVLWQTALRKPKLRLYAGNAEGFPKKKGYLPFKSRQDGPNEIERIVFYLKNLRSPLAEHWTINFHYEKILEIGGIGHVDSTGECSRLVCAGQTPIKKDFPMPISQNGQIFFPSNVQSFNIIYTVGCQGMRKSVGYVDFEVKGEKVHFAIRRYRLPGIGKLRLDLSSRLHRISR